MLRIVKICVFLTLALAAVVSHAQGKIAVLDVQQAILLTDESQKRLNGLRSQSSYKENKSELDELKKEHDDIIQKLQKDLAVMSDAQKEDQRRLIEEKRGDIEHVMRKLQSSEKQLAEQLVREMAPKLQEIVGELIETEGIGLLLKSEAVLHAENSYNITAKVTDRLNQAN